MFIRNSIGIYTDVERTFEANSDIFKNVFYECSTSFYTYKLKGTNIFENDIIGSMNYSIRTYLGGCFFWNNFLYNVRTNITFERGNYHGIKCDRGRSPNFNNPFIEDQGNYWSDGGYLDIDKDGILDNQHLVGEFDNGYQFHDERPLLFPIGSKHLLLDFNGGRNSINFTWELPDYDFLGNLTSLILHRSDLNGQDIILGEVLEGPGFFNDPNLGDNTNYTYYLNPTFENVEGYPSNSVTAFHDNSTPIIDITSPENGSIYKNERGILIEWKVENEVYSHLQFRVKVNDGEWDQIGTQFSYKPDELIYGINTIMVEVTDHMGFNDSDEVTVILDWFGPQIDILSPIDPMIYNGTAVYLSWNVWDEYSEVSEVKIRIDNRDWIEVTELNGFRFYDLYVGEHVFHIEAIDSIGNRETTELHITIVLYDTPVKIVRPLEGERFNTRNISLEWEIKKPHFVDSILLSLEGDEWIPIDHALSRNISFKTDGFKNIKIKAISKAGFEFMDEVNISIDTTAPFVIHTSPRGGLVPIDAWIFITFSEEMDKDSVMIFVDSWVGEISWYQNRAMVKYPGQFEYNKEVLVEVQGKDLYGNEMDVYSYSFNTTDIGFVIGRVLDEYGVPIIEASILFGTGEETYTDINGSFSFELHEGENHIQISEDGYDKFDIHFNITAGSQTDLGEIILNNADNVLDASQYYTLLLIFFIGLALIAIVITAVIVIRKKNGQISAIWEE